MKVKSAICVSHTQQIFFSILMCEKCISLLRGEGKEVLVNLLNNLNVFCFQQNKTFPGKKTIFSFEVQKTLDKYFEKNSKLMPTREIPSYFRKAHSWKQLEIRRGLGKGPCVLLHFVFTVFHKHPFLGNSGVQNCAVQQLEIEASGYRSWVGPFGPFSCNSLPTMGDIRTCGRVQETFLIID